MRSPDRRKPRVITLAIVASLGVHLAVLPFLRVPASARAMRPAVIAIDRSHRPRHPLVIPPPPTPQPRIVRATPPPQRTSRVAAIAPRAHARAANVRRQAPPFASAGRDPAPGTGTSIAGDPRDGSTAGAGGGTPGGVPLGEPATPLPTAASTPAPVESPACANAPHDASVRDAVTPDRPAIAAEEGAVGRAEVRVDLSATGAVLSASVYRSTGNAALDNAAVDAARRATFAPASDGCRTVAGSYVYTVDYSE